MKKTGFALIAFCLVAGAALAQGEITDGGITFGYNQFTPEVRTNFEVNNGTDHMFQQWWYYRVLGQTSETPLPPPDLDLYGGNVATLIWTDVNGQDFSAFEITTLEDTGSFMGSVRHDLTITNDSQGPLLITVFHYSDLDVDASRENDIGVEFTPTNLAALESSVANYRGLGADAFQVTEFSGLRDALDDNSITALDNSGTPFGPGDFTSGYQWDLAVIPVGASSTWTIHTVDDATDPLELAFSGDCPGSAELRISGAQPFATVNVAGADAVGTFSIPNGGCSGTELNLDENSVELLGSVVVDGNGTRTLSLNLPNSLCGQIAQALDVSTCGVTNTDVIP